MAFQDTNNSIQQELESLKRALSLLQARCDGLEHEVQALRLSSHSTSVKTSIDIPQEVSNVIIDFLHDDTQALKTCSLVSRAWVRAARYHLFHTWCISPKNQRSGMNLLKRPLCTYTTYLRRVVYTGEEKDPSKLQVLPWTSDTFDICAPASVHSMVIKHRRMDLRYWASEVDLSRFTPFLQNITQLHLANIMCNALTFITVILQFPSLVKLKLQKITMPTDNAHGVHDIELWQTMPDSLRVLEIGDDVADPWVWSFVGRESTKSLETFRMKIPSDELILALRLAPYFQNAGTSLTTLGLRFESLEEEVNFFQSVDLRENRKVRCLEIGGLLQFEGSGFAPSYLRILSVLSVIQITAITTLVLDVDILDPLSNDSPDEITQDDLVDIVCPDDGWDLLDELLAGWQFPLLETIHFRVQHDRIYNMVIPNHVRSRLPKCRANRSITFTFVDADDQ